LTAYEIELLEDIEISHIFNTTDLHPYQMDDTRGTYG
jgi:hypothetical protein